MSPIVGYRFIAFKGGEQNPSMTMRYIDDWVDRALACFYKERDKWCEKCEPPKDPEPPIDEGKISDDFAKFVADLGLDASKRQELIAYPASKKIVLLNSKNGQAAVEVGSLLHFLASLDDASLGRDDVLQELQDLVITLRTQGESFLTSFITEAGLPLLSDRLGLAATRIGHESAVFLLLCAFRALLNSEVGRSSVLQDDAALLQIARCIDVNDAKSKIVAVEILSGLCFVPEEGHPRILKSITEASPLLGERTRFQKLVDDLHRTYPTDLETDRVRTAILGLFNALLKNGAAENSVHFRLHLRLELLMLGIHRALDAAKESASLRLEDHIDLFEMMRKEDEITLSGSSEDSGSSSPVDFESVVGMTEALHEKLSTSLALPHFISLLQHLFMVPCDEKHVPLWKLFDLILQQLTLQTTVCGITDVHKPLTGNMDMEEVMSRLHTQCEYEEAEREVERLKSELEAEKMRCIELENRLADLQDGRDSLSSRISTASSSPSDPCPSPTLLPPVCPPVAPPPPPPLALGAKPKPSEEVKKKVPQPRAPLKSLNWNKFTAEKAKGTVWEFIDDEKFYKQLDLSDLEQTFGASSHKDDDTETVVGTISRRQKEQKITVIDPRRYQNCTIMLSKLKLTHKEIRHALMSMDEKSKLPKDMIEQMLKFVPSKEEINLLNEAVSRHSSPSILALADRYLFEVAQIPRFEQRLKCLFVIRSFKDRIDCLVPSIQATHKASASLSTNKRFKQYLALILAVGNYLNYGKRNGNAYGFDLKSLPRLVDVKMAQRADRNLLHYLVSWIDRNIPDLLKMEREMSNMFEAARFNRAEVQNEIRSLEQAITSVRAELAFVENRPDENEDSKKDKFVSVAKQFISSATNDYNNLEKQFSEMKLKFAECARLFGFDSQASPEELFSILAKAMHAFAECLHQHRVENEEIEKKKRQTITLSYFAKKSRRHDKHPDFELLIKSLQNGDIFSEELNRLRASYRMPKRNRAPKA